MLTVCHRRRCRCAQISMFLLLVFFLYVSPSMQSLINNFQFSYVRPTQLNILANICSRFCFYAIARCTSTLTVSIWHLFIWNFVEFSSIMTKRCSLQLKIQFEIVSLVLSLFFGVLRVPDELFPQQRFSLNARKSTPRKMHERRFVRFLSEKKIYIFSQKNKRIGEIELYKKWKIVYILHKCVWFKINSISIKKSKLR